MLKMNIENKTESVIIVKKNNNKQQRHKTKFMYCSVRPCSVNIFYEHFMKESRIVCKQYEKSVQSIPMRYTSLRWKNLRTHCLNIQFPSDTNVNPVMVQICKVTAIQNTFPQLFKVFKPTVVPYLSPLQHNIKTDRGTFIHTPVGTMQRRPGIVQINIDAVIAIMLQAPIGFPHSGTLYKQIFFL